MNSPTHPYFTGADTELDSMWRLSQCLNPLEGLEPLQVPDSQSGCQSLSFYLVLLVPLGMGQFPTPGPGMEFCSERGASVHILALPEDGEAN